MNPLLSVRELRVEYPAPGFRTPPKRILDGVSFDIAGGRTLGLVGESGSGKSTIGRAIVGLAPVASGSITFDDIELAALSTRQRRRSAHEVQMVFQDPYSSLNPSMTIEDILTEPLRVSGMGAADARSRVSALLDAVHLPSDAGKRLAKEFSGGQRQRIAIARALAGNPRLIVCDEPTSALDLSTQRAVLDLLIEIQRRTGVAYLFISHDLSVVRHISHDVAVIHRGKIVETGDGAAVTGSPQHPYTQALFAAAPRPDPAAQRDRRAQRLAVGVSASNGFGP